MLDRVMREKICHRGRGIACASALILGLATGGCADSTASGTSTDAAASGAGVIPRTVVAIVDFSGSMPSHAVGDARQYLEKVVNGLDYGDRLVLLEMYRTGARDSVREFVRDMPTIRGRAATSYDARELEANRRAVLNALPVFFDPELTGTVPTTDLFTTLHIAAERLRDAGEREKELLILSDMLQSTPRFEFEGGRRLPADGWIARQAEERWLPSLASTCVFVVGADHTTPHGQRVRSFWHEYFQATGATLDTGSYRLRAPTDVVGC